MKNNAALLLKALYCLNLSALIFPSLYAARSWVSLAIGAGVFSLPLAMRTLFLVAVISRLVYVLVKPNALAMRKNSRVIRFVWLLGVFLMVLGTLSAILILFIPFLVNMYFGASPDVGVVYFVAGIYLVVGSYFAFPGMLLFETGRILGAKLQSKDEPDSV